MFPRLTDEELARLAEFGEPRSYPGRRSGRARRRRATGLAADPLRQGRGHAARRRRPARAHRHPRARQFHGRARAAFRPALAGRRGRPDRCRGGRHPARPAARPADRRSRSWRADHARADPAPRRPDRGRRADRSSSATKPMPTSFGWSISFAATAIPTSISIPRTTAARETLIERFQVEPEELPIVLCPSGKLLRNPERGPARALRRAGRPDRRRQALRRRRDRRRARRASPPSVYAASEGLSVLAIDCRSFGGQAGASARIENYLGFPTGISGMALMGRAFSQAQKFGVEIAIPDEAVKLECGNDPLPRPAGHRRAHPGARRRDRHRRPLPPPGRRAARRIRGLVGPLLGLAARSRSLRRPGSRAGRRRQFGRARRPSSLPAARGSVYADRPPAARRRPCRNI